MTNISILISTQLQTTVSKLFKTCFIGISTQKLSTYTFIYHKQVSNMMKKFIKLELRERGARMDFAVKVDQ